MQPQNPSANNDPNSQPSQGGGSPTFQIPRSDGAQMPPATPSVPQPSTYTPSSPNPNLPPQPDIHQAPIFMQEDASEIPLPFTKSGTASSAPTDPFAPSSQVTQRPPVQTQIPRPAPVQQPILPTTLPSKPRRQSSFAKYLAAGVVILLIAGLLVWGVSSLVGNKEPEKPAVTKPEYKEFVSETLGFATAYPDGWTHEEGRKNGLDLVRFAHPKIRENNTATAEVAVLRLTSKQLGEIDSKTQFFDTYTKTIADGFSSYSENSATEMTIDELPAKKVEADIVQNGENDRAVFYLIYADKDAFIIVTSADKSQYADLKSNLEVFVDRFENRITTETIEETAE